MSRYRSHRLGCRAGATCFIIALLSSCLAPGWILAGQRQANKLKVFISYSRADEAFADELNLGLDDKGYTVELDKHSIRQGEEWKARLAS